MRGRRRACFHYGVAPFLRPSRRYLCYNAVKQELNVAQAIAMGENALTTRQDADVRIESKILLATAMGLPSKESLLLLKQGLNTPVAPSELDSFSRRIEGEPIAYITGTREFWGMPFKVTRATLIPRPDSETLIETALSLFAETNKQPRSILDLGTGSGCLLISLLKEFKEAKGLGIDMSEEALGIAAFNASSVGIDKTRVSFLKSDWFSNIPVNGNTYQLVVSNPPYVADDCSIPEVSNYEPHSALFAGKDGLDVYRKFARSPALPKLLDQDGFVVLEIGQGQHTEVRRIFEESEITKLKFVTVTRDLNNIERCIVFRQ